MRWIKGVEKVLVLVVALVVMMMTLMMTSIMTRMTFCFALGPWIMFDTYTLVCK